MENLIEKYKEEFNDYLDEQGDIVIGSFSMAPSVVLETMDEDSYREQILEFIQDKKLNYSDTIYSNFPAPIAFFFERTINSAENENHQLQLLRSTWESVIYILFATVLGEIHKKDFNLNPVRIFSNQSIRNDHNGTLSDKLGWKLEFIQKLLEYDQENDSVLRISGYLTTEHIDTLKELNQERNSYSHIAALNPSQARERFNFLLPKVQDLLFELDFLENVSIIRYKNSSGGIGNLRFNRFDGHSLREVNYNKTLSPEELTALNDILHSDNMLMEFDDEIFCITPFIHFIKEGVAEKLVICYFKKVNRTTSLWLYEPIAGSETEVEIDPSVFRYNINERLAI